MGLRIPCLRCGRFEEECRCPPLPEDPGPPPPPATAPPAAKKKLRPEIIAMRREKRGSGREVVILEGFPADAKVEEIARALKRRCGSGGTVRRLTIELQGDHRDAAAAILLEHGFRSRRAGG